MQRPQLLLASTPTSFVPTSLSRLLSTHLALDAHGAGLLTSRTFRSVAVSRHLVHSGIWEWNNTVAEHEKHAAVIFSSDSTPLPISGDFVPARGPAVGLMLPCSGESTIRWSNEAEILIVWAPEFALMEFSDDAMLEPTAFSDTPLAQGFRAFAYTMSRTTDAGSSVSHYVIERLLLEMMFGTKLEQATPDPSTLTSPSLLDTARSIMLLNRENPEFTTAQLAAELNVSVRQLQRTFARASTTPGDVLRQLRVELAESMLQNPKYRMLSIEDLARYSGFSNSLQLRRALKAEGRESPTVIRQRVGLDDGSFQPSQTGQPS